MDPWLEQPALWADVHNRLVAEIGNTLGPPLRPRYYVSLEERVYLADVSGRELVGRPDVTVADPSGRGPRRETGGSPAVSDSAGTLTVTVPMPDEVRETYLEIRELGSARAVTVIEVLSPANKLVAGEGRRRYQEKRLVTLGTATSLVEIDLLRSGEPMTVHGAETSRAPYRILVSPGWQRPNATLFAFGLRDPIPAFPVPLRAAEEGPILDLGQLLSRLYSTAAYDLRIDYGSPLVPRLGNEDAAWAAERVQASGSSGGERG